MNNITLHYVDIEYAEPIVYFTYKEGVELGFPEIRELISYAEKLSNHRPYLTFSNVPAGVNVTNEGKRILNDGDNMPLFRGGAILVHNSLYQFAITFLSTFKKNKYPLCAFTSKDKAINWLLSLPLS